MVGFVLPVLLCLVPCTLPGVIPPANYPYRLYYSYYLLGLTVRWFHYWDWITGFPVSARFVTYLPARVVTHPVSLFPIPFAFPVDTCLAPEHRLRTTYRACCPCSPLPQTLVLLWFVSTLLPVPYLPLIPRYLLQRTRPNILLPSAAPSARPYGFWTCVSRTQTGACCCLTQHRIRQTLLGGGYHAR